MGYKYDDINVYVPTSDEEEIDKTIIENIRTT
jgi:hypothetical protein